METTLSILEKQIKNRLKGVDHYESIYINQVLSHLLDTYDIPEEAKLACLTIDTAMRHLDEVYVKNTSKKSILIGDLLSAHFYTLLAVLNNPDYQKDISSAIVEVNEIKSSVHQDTLDKSLISSQILKVENIFLIITLNHYATKYDLQIINEKLLNNIIENKPSYLNKYTDSEVKNFISNI
ncbi:heptaprenyl pyrophosphate synthase subunit A [Staphylococcus sp. ACRSN]|uniref:heptaprenyl pyrophosphate synthase subunit A n=1 Tax=Staphylococcus sp. ACRSN TaxID=2918214 RepID=UPI001EF2012C|nr:heptaprenyl pyrophosphate synthase subunit A [Staphylococcus sp. ACRSN]MCG7339670.1 heptaprenyl pyrophosphate synthase subunit A [Staphylococcus sp. ACRSN]